MSLEVRIVQACQRDGQGGSPTAVVDETPMTETERRAVAVQAGTSHAVFISIDEPDPDRPAASLRFFTAAGELPACGHGTVAALAVLAHRAGTPAYEVVLRSGGRTYLGSARADGASVMAEFDPGPVALREAAEAERRPILSALGLTDEAAFAGCRIASVGRPRMLVPVADRQVLAGLVPDLTRLRAACADLGLLGCYVYSPPSSDGRAAARMFAPSIGVPEDIANANSTACLAAHLADGGVRTLYVDMGDSLGEPATVVATARPGPDGPLIRVGGAATIRRPG